MSGDATIFALSSAPGRGAIAVYRISGPRAGKALAIIAGIGAPTPRRAVRVTLRDPATLEVLDEALAIWFPAPHSYTGEDMAELQVHGGRAVIEAVGLALGRVDGLVPASPGAFTRRAFFAGKLDLTQVEAIADLIAAETEAQRRQAQRQAGGALAALYDGWRAQLVSTLAHVEAQIDFPDEDLPEGLNETIAASVSRLEVAIDAHLRDDRRGERLRDGVSVAIVGPPNVGKSSLFNYLAGRDAAIVSTEAGTTRDVIEIHLDLGGYPAVVADTAGLRAAGDAIEAEGIARARARADDADVTVLVLDAAALDDIGGAPHSTAIVAANKIDLTPVPAGTAVLGLETLSISVRTGTGLDRLVSALGAAVAEKAALSSDLGPTRMRHRLALEACRSSLARTLVAGEAALVAEGLRAAADALGRITGRIDVEDLLDAIFRDFCIGK